MHIFVPWFYDDLLNWEMVELVRLYSVLLIIV